MKDEILQQVWEAQGEAYELMNEYDTLPHRYGKDTLYQAEEHIIDLIAVHPGITATDLAGILNKTVSACSQMIRKLRAKDWVKQVRNESNNRLYNLWLTETGEQIYQAHFYFVKEYRSRMFHLLEKFSTEELTIHLAVQKQLNEAYQEDVRKIRKQS